MLDELTLEKRNILTVNIGNYKLEYSEFHNEVYRIPDSKIEIYILDDDVWDWKSSHMYRKPLPEDEISERMIRAFEYFLRSYKIISEEEYQRDIRNLKLKLLLNEL